MAFLVKVRGVVDDILQSQISEQPTILHAHT